MEIKIGVLHSPRELVLDIGESADSVEGKVSEAISSDGVLSFTDNRGRRVLVPAARVAYVEIGGGVTGQVGFRS